MIPPLLQVTLWGIMSGIASMALYAKLSPQVALTALKDEQKKSRAALKAYDGDMAGLMTLIHHDLRLSWRQMRLVFLPFIFSIAPVVALMTWLYSPYAEVQYFESTYIAALLVSSLIIKLKYRII